MWIDGCEKRDRSRAVAISSDTLKGFDLQKPPIVDHSGAKETQFSDLLGPAAWRRLPAQVRRRFSRVIPTGGWLLYQGKVATTDFSLLGRILAHAARLVGSPLPLCDAPDCQAFVAVSNASDGSGQDWTRMYGRPGRFSQVVHSRKRFSGPTGLEEYVGYGIGMALVLEERDGALVFSSDHYFLELFGRRVALPDWLSPGRMEIVHAQEERGSFSFTLRLTHKWVGRLVTQRAYFKEVEQ